MPLLYPQEVEVYYLIPALRKRFALELKRKNKSQKEIAKLLGVTEAAVSQYLKNKRAREIKFNLKIIKEIKKSSSKINTPLDSLREIQKILNIIRHSKLICIYHKKFLKDLPKNCSACYITKAKGK